MAEEILEKKDKKSNIRPGFKAVWRQLQPFKKELAFLTVLGLISAAANGAVPYVTGQFFDALIAVSKGDFTGDVPLWVVFLTAWTLIQLVANNVDWVLDRFRRDIDTKLQLNVQLSGFLHLYRLPMLFHKNERINQVLDRLSRASWQMSSIMRTGITLLPQFLSVLIGITLAASINSTLAGILIVGVLLYVILLARILIPIAEIDEKAHRLWNEAWGDAADAVHQVDSVKQSAAEEHESRKARDAFMGKAYEFWYKLERSWSNVSFFQRIIVFLTQLAVFIVSVQFISKGTITIGELVALNGYSMMFFGPFVQLGFSWQTLQNGLTSASHAEEIFQKKTEEYTPAGGISPLSLNGSVEFKNVSFSYAEGQPMVLNSVNFSVRPGEIVALVGESGVGKSTAVSLISGYYFPSQGAVLIDGEDTRKFNLTALRQRIAVVPQEIALFNDTIKANISYGSFDATDDQVVYAAKEAHIEEFVESLPLKYETLVGERGLKLSVGQKQRVSIARAVLRNPSILILDEPTSALDAQTEQIITKSFEKLMKGRTTFIIAHRLSTVRKANKIIVFEKGEIAEAGTHQELVAKEGGVYRRLYEYQIGLH